MQSKDRSDLIAFLVALGAGGAYALWRTYNQEERQGESVSVSGSSDFSDREGFKGWGYAMMPYSNSANFTNELYGELMRFERETGIPAPWLAAILYHEGANFRVNARNSSGGRVVAGGIAQYTRTRLKDLGYSLTPKEMSDLPLSDQFDVLIKDYKRFSDRIASPGDLYLAHAGPAGLGKGAGYVLGDVEGDKQQRAFYNGVPGFDNKGNKDGKITVGEVIAFGDALFREGLRNQLKQK